MLRFTSRRCKIQGKGPGAGLRGSELESLVRRDQYGDSEVSKQGYGIGLGQWDPGIVRSQGRDGCQHGRSEVKDTFRRQHVGPGS